MKDNSLLNWEYPERRSPKLDDPDYLGSKGLSLALQRAITQELSGKSDLKILDVGCGRKPFYPFLKPFANTYIGTDVITDSSFVDVICPAEHLDISDGWADVVLCLSVLEHVDDPIQAVKELFRVAKPGSVIFASTHGCFPWHPYPQDHWRWTQTGLPLLFTRYGEALSVECFSTRGTISGIFFLLAHYAYDWGLQGQFKSRLRSPLVSLINRLGEWLDHKTPGLWDVNRHVTAIPEFFIIAKK